MKKVKVTVNAGSPGRTLLLFPSPEGAYIWVTEAHADPEILERIPDVERVALLPGEFIEAEWRGCEYAYEGQGHVRLDLTRFAKATKPANASGLLVSVHYGWVSEHILPFHAYKDDDIEVLPLAPEDQKFDLAVLFKDAEEEEK